MCFFCYYLHEEYGKYERWGKLVALVMLSEFFARESKQKFNFRWELNESFWGGWNLKGLKNGEIDFEMIFILKKGGGGTFIHQFQSIYLQKSFFFTNSTLIVFAQSSHNLHNFLSVFPTDLRHHNRKPIHSRWVITTNCWWHILMNSKRDLIFLHNTSDIFYCALPS